MKDVSLNMSLIEKEFENLILTSKLYINNKELNNREQEELSVLKNNIDALKLEMDHITIESKEGRDPQTLMALSILTKIIRKFHTSIRLLEKTTSKEPLYRQMDVRNMLDILLNNTRSLIYHNTESVNHDKLEADLQTIESLDEQHKRVLMTYLMQDWKNLKEVLTLIKVGEIYKSIAEKLVDVSLLMNPSERQ